MPVTELEKILCTSGLTILGGVLVFVFGHIAVRFFIDPHVEQRRTIGEVVHALIYHADVYANPGISPKEVRDEVQRVLREKASLLLARTYAIPLYNVFVSLRLSLPREDMYKVARSLMFLSNSVHRGDPMEIYNHREAIRMALRLPSLI